MRNLFSLSVLIFTLIFSNLTLADLEHRPGQGTLPKREKLSTAHGCFREIDELGCGHPRDDQEFFISCVHDKQDDLTPSCKPFFETKYGRRK